MLAVIAIGLGIAAGVLAGGAFGRLAHLRLRHEVGIVILFVFQGLARGRIFGTRATVIGLVVWVASSLVLVVALAPSARLTGVSAVMLGLGLNLFIVLANSGMPVLLAGLGESQTAAAALATSGGFYHVAAGSTAFVSLADVLRFSVGSNKFFLSVGDLLLVVGAAMVLAKVMLTVPATEGEPRTS
jgi:hypothetical protein